MVLPRPTQTINSRIPWGSLLLALTAAVWAALLVAAEDTSQKSGDRIAGEQLPKVIDQFNALAVRFDTDHDRALSPQEQDALVQYVEQQHGHPWAQRARQFVRSADTNGDGIVDEKEWLSAIE
jgi:hypothetical protein